MVFSTSSLKSIKYKKIKMEASWQRALENDVRRAQRAAQPSALQDEVECMRRRLSGPPPNKVDPSTVYMTDDDRRAHRACLRYVDVLRNRKVEYDRQKALGEVKVALSTRL